MLNPRRRDYGKLRRSKRDVTRPFLGLLTALYIKKKKKKKSLGNRSVDNNETPPWYSSDVWFRNKILAAHVPITPGKLYVTLHDGRYVKRILRYAIARRREEDVKGNFTESKRKRKCPIHSQDSWGRDSNQREEKERVRDGENQLAQNRDKKVVHPFGSKVCDRGGIKIAKVTGTGWLSSQSWRHVTQCHSLVFPDASRDAQRLW